MVKFTDILIEILLLIIFFVFANFLWLGTDYPLLTIIPLVGYSIIHFILKRRKRIIEYVRDDFEKLGYELIDEKPTKLFNSEIKVKPSILINGIPVSRFGYIRQYGRIFTTKSKEGKLFKLNTIVTKKWNGKNQITIIKKKAL